MFVGFFSASQIAVKGHQRRTLLKAWSSGTRWFSRGTLPAKLLEASSLYVLNASSCLADKQARDPRLIELAGVSVGRYIWWKVLQYLKNFCGCINLVLSFLSGQCPQKLLKNPSYRAFRKLGTGRFFLRFLDAHKRKNTNQGMNMINSCHHWRDLIIPEVRYVYFLPFQKLIHLHKMKLLKHLNMNQVTSILISAKMPRHLPKAEVFFL